MPSRPHGAIPVQWLVNDAVYRDPGTGGTGPVGCGFQVKPHLGWDFRDRLVTDYSAVLVLRGTGTYHDHAGRSWPLVPGSLLQRFTVQRHSHHITPDGTWAECWISLCPAMERMLIALGAIDPGQPVSTPGIHAALVGRIAHQREVLRRAAPQSLLRQVWELVDILLALLEAGRQADGRGAHAEAIDDACRRLAREPGLALVALAQGTGLSVERFRKVFQRNVGCSLARFRIRCRMELARERLHDPAISVRAIARELGYANPNAFSACFRRETGTSPSAYRG